MVIYRYPIIFLFFLSCGYELRNFKKVEELENFKLTVVNRTPEPELEILMEKESLRLFERGGIKITDDGKNSISIYILSYDVSPSPFFSAIRPAYRVTMKVRVAFERKEKKREKTISQYEEYLKSGIISFDRENEEDAKNSIVKFIADEVYEELINFLNEEN